MTPLIRTFSTISEKEYIILATENCSMSLDLEYEGHIQYKNLRSRTKKIEKYVVGPLRFERRTSRLSAVRSTRLSYGPEMKYKYSYKNRKVLRKEYKIMVGGPAAIRTQDLTVISRALHQAKLRAQISDFLEYRS